MMKLNDLIQQKIILSILKQGNNAFSKDQLRSYLKVSSNILDSTLEKFLEMNLIQQVGGVFRATSSQRLELAIQAINFGADIEHVSKYLTWDEFEDLTSKAFLVKGYEVLKHFRFKYANKRNEIDILAFKKPLILCVDCKHWKRGLKSSLERIVKDQIKRAERLSQTLENSKLRRRVSMWEKIILVPIILSLTAVPSKFCHNVPIVPILQLRDFLDQLPAYIDSLKTFRVNLKTLEDY